MAYSMMIVSLAIVCHISSSQSQAPTQDHTTKEFQDSCLQSHNKYRKRHASPNLTIDNDLVDFAKKRAKTCAENGKLEHDPKGTGENLYWNSDPKPLDGTRAIGRWYAEVDKYDYDKPGFSEQTGHFTQLVWKKTTRVGCGQATSKHGLYMSCNYLSAGNVEGQYEKNVLKPKDDKHAKVQQLMINLV